MLVDNRTPSQVLRDYNTMERVKKRLVQSGLIDGDATFDDVIELLRKLVPPDLVRASKS